MTLKQYIEKLGDESAARMLGISTRAARSYREGQRAPRPEKARDIVKRSRGKLTMESVYG